MKSASISLFALLPLGVSAVAAAYWHLERKVKTEGKHEKIKLNRSSLFEIINNGGHEMRENDAQVVPRTLGARGEESLAQPRAKKTSACTRHRRVLLKKAATQIDLAELGFR